MNAVLKALGVLVLVSGSFSLPKLHAGDFSFEFAGYAKNLAIRSTSILTNEAYLLNTGRLRTEGGISAGNFLRAEIWLDHEVLAGDFFTTPDYQLSQAIEAPTYLDLTWTIDEGEKHQVRQSLFRAFTSVYAGAATITAGRQRIAWGTGFAWNPTDLFNPFNPAAIELDEKAGVDAVHVAIPTGGLSRLEAAFAPGRKSLKSSYAAKYSTHTGQYDMSIMAGSFREKGVFGGDFAGYIGDAGFRGELAYTFDHDASDYLRAIVNMDYNFPNDLYAMIEVYYNGQGASDKEDYDLQNLLTGESFNLAKLYTAISATKMLAPLLTGSIYGIINLNDRSNLLGPALQYSIAENLELSACVYFLTGADDSEYGQPGTSYFVYLQYFF
jgi:hypothetical protein